MSLTELAFDHYGLRLNRCYDLKPILVRQETSLDAGLDMRVRRMVLSVEETVLVHTEISRVGDKLPLSTFYSLLVFRLSKDFGYTI